MTNLGDIVTSASVMWIKKYLDNVDRDWKVTMECLSKSKNLRLFLMSNFSVYEIPETMPTYYVQSITNWSNLSFTPLESFKIN